MTDRNTEQKIQHDADILATFNGTGSLQATADTYGYELADVTAALDRARKHRIEAKRGAQ